ncbi:HIT-like domain-containing protein [Apiosordaria backusii]|uniref:Aprataxin-like protein n=1 Tax=Apiosordaria backusii TaxID=314023 RepID=A0AA40B372_9PEZI|nr:HIT-like domain-containing protein [Apiosordaria backusii]
MAEQAEDIDDIIDPPMGAGPSKHHNETSSTSSKPKNAFTELMAPKRKSSSSPPDQPPKKDKRDRWRGALVQYIDNPSSFGTQVLRVTPNTVLIKDSFPKATVHLLLLPRSKKHSLLRPNEAFADPAFLAIVQEEAASAAKLAAAELERLVGSYSATNKPRVEATDYANRPPGRDYLKEIKVGMHAHPSMDHLHVHIISKDMHSDKVKHKKHYNSFTTEFFIPLVDYPLAEGDIRRDVGFQNGNLSRDFKCWRCGRDFGNKFTQLKKHLDEEFEEWKRE